MDEINLDFTSEDDKTPKEMPKWKKYSIIGGVICLFVIIMIIIIILIAKSSNADHSEPLGEINCKYILIIFLVFLGSILLSYLLQVVYNIGIYVGTFFRCLYKIVCNNALF